MPAYPDWESSWPEYDYTIPLGATGFLTDEPPAEPKPRHPIGFHVPPAKRRTTRTNKPAAKKPGGKKPRKRERKK